MFVDYSCLVMNQERQRHGFKKIENQKELVFDFVFNEMQHPCASWLGDRNFAATATSHQITVIATVTIFFSLGAFTALRFKREAAVKSSSDVMMSMVDHSFGPNANYSPGKFEEAFETLTSAVLAKYGAEQLETNMFNIFCERIAEIDDQNGAREGVNKLLGWLRLIDSLSTNPGDR